MRQIYIYGMFIFFTIVIFPNVHAVEKITVELNSDKVLLDEQVTATIKVETDSEEKPEVNIDPINAEIVTSGFEGVSTSSVYANGHLTTKKEFIFSAIVQPKSIGRSGLSNIFATIGGKTIRHETVWFSCVKEKADVPPVFVLAVPSKTRVYQNESILLRYYLMTQVDDVRFDIKEFPKLNNFVKRYLQENVTKELVSYEGKRYIRQQLYSLVLFPEKAKLLKIDPMRVQAVYDPNGNRDPFGFGGGSYTSKVISSKSIDVEVIEIPSEKTPTGFTGLVGKHKFSLSVNKTKVLVNEPIEVKLKITGNGNLEGLDAPSIITDSVFETFDTNSNFELIDSTTATKTFEYTYLPRKATKIAAQKIPLSYFNPDTKEFESAEVDLPAIEVVGGVYQEKKLDENVNQTSENETTEKSEAQIQSKYKKSIFNEPRYAPPIFDQSIKTEKKIHIINTILIFILIISFMYLIWINRVSFLGKRDSIYKKKFEIISDLGLSYSSLEDLLLDFPSINSNASLAEKINQLKLPENVKNRLHILLDELNDKYKKSSGDENKVSQSWKLYRKELSHLVQSLEEWDRLKMKSEV